MILNRASPHIYLRRSRHLHSSFKRGVQPESKDAPPQEQTLIFFFHFCYNKTILRTFTPMRFSGDTPGMMVLGKTVIESLPYDDSLTGRKSAAGLGNILRLGFPAISDRFLPPF